MEESKIKDFSDSLRIFGGKKVSTLCDIQESWWEKVKAPAIEDIQEEKEVAKDESSEDEAPTPEKSLPDAGSWIVSTTRGTYCLHIIGNCHRIPGKHYKSRNEVKPGVKEDHFARYVSL